MTEKKSPARLLAEASRIVPFSSAAWPDEFTSNVLAALMAGGRKEPHKQDFLVWLRLIGDGIEAGTLAARIAETRQNGICRSRRDPFWVEPLRVDGVRMVSGRGIFRRETGEPVVATIRKIDRPSAAAWLRAIGEPPGELVRAWLGDAWQVDAGRVAPAADSRPAERQDYFRSLWIEFDKPVRNDRIWKALRERAGKEDCPVLSVTGNAEFVFRYADECTDRLEKTIFQKDMSAVRVPKG